MAKWVCNVCGYVYEGDAAPEVCPVCKAPASKFKEQSGEKTWAAEHVVGVAQGVPEDMLLKAGKFGVCKINIDTDLRLAMTASIRKYMHEHPADFDPRQYLKPAREAIKQMVVHKMRDVLNSSGRL